MRAPCNKIITRRVYGYFLSKDNTLLYIGSSHCTLNSLEYNHRNAHKKWPNEKQTKFRKALLSDIKEGYFKTLVEMQCDLETIEQQEGMLIRALRPPYNIDLDPVKKSALKGRYDYEKTKTETVR